MTLVIRLHDDDVGAAFAIGPELLLLARGVVADDRPRRVEDALRAAVVLLELHDGRVGVVALEVEDVPHVGAAPREDALIVVTDDREVLLEAGEVPQQLVLRAVRVLVFIDEDVLVAVLPPLEGAIARREKADREEQQVVEVERVVLAQQRFVPRPHERGDALELALRRRGHVGRSVQLVLRAGDRRGDRAGRDHLLGDALVGHRLAQERALVGLVVDRERPIDANDRPVVAEQPRAEAVERTDRQLPDPLPIQQAVEPLAHLTRSLVREGHREDRPRGHPLADEVRDAVCEDAGLARAGAGEDQQRAFAVGDSGALLGIEGIEDQVGHRFQLWT